MRSRWEGSGKADLDEPASITERQLRSLRRGSRAGVLAILLALVAAGAAGWSLIMGPDALAGLEGVQDVKLKVLSAIGQPAPTENHQVQAPTSRPDNSQAQGGVPASTPATPSNGTSQDSSASQPSVSNGR